jgi:uncharacterized membrane protein
MAAGASSRLTSIDALRGLVMIIMLLDHVRETFFLHMQVGDPVDAATVAPLLFFTRLASAICAPVFIALAGISAWLYGQRHDARATALFLLKRGAFLMVLELTLVGFAWSAQLPPQTFWLQVIWAIGVCMIVLAALIHLPRPAVIAIGLILVAGHNLLDGIVLTAGDPLFVPWAMLHQRAAFDVAGFVVKTSYPVLPWIGVIALGYGVGPWFAAAGAVRRRRLMLLGTGMIAGFLLLRGLNLYGDRPWAPVEGAPVRTVMGFLALTKYPPSLLFLLATLGIGAVLLAQFERLEGGRLSRWFAVLGGAPMFFYLLHLYVLRALYLLALAIMGANKGAVFGVDHVAWIWVLWAALIVPLYGPTQWFARLKRRRRDLGWLKYL